MRNAQNTHRQRGFTLTELMVAVSVLAFIWVAVVGAMVTAGRVTKKVSAYAQTQSRVLTALEQVRSELCMGSAGAMNIRILDSARRIEFRDPNLPGTVSCFRLQNGNLEYDNNINTSPGFVIRSRGLSNAIFQLLPGGAVVRVTLEATAKVGYNESRPLSGIIEVYLRN